MEKGKARLIMVLLWTIIVCGAGAGYHFIIQPRLAGNIVAATSSDSSFAHTISCAADGFSGYAFLRSPAIAKALKEHGIKLEVRDDKADYQGRVRQLADGTLDLAVFTLDALLKAGVATNVTSYEQFPGSVVLVIDQTVGADAMVAYEQAVPTLEALNHADGRFVFTPDSPSEFLARVVYAQLAYPLIPDQWYESASGAADVLAKLKVADPTAKRIYVLWEPYLSEALKIKGVKKLFGSDKCTDCIVDVLVVRREYLAEHRDLVDHVVRAYFTAAHSYQQTTDALHELIVADAKAFGDTFNAYQASAIADGIQWKRVRENYAHFGIEEARGVRPIEELVTYVMGKLVQTSAFPKDALQGKPNTLYYDGFMRQLHAEGYHPGKKATIIADLGPGAADLDPARAAAELQALDDTGWKKLAPVGSARVEPIGFLRGTAAISEFSQADLDQLITNLGTWSQYYVHVMGRSQATGNAAANAALAAERAEAVRTYLTAHGIAASRLRASGATPSADGKAEVQFILLQQQY